jgi:hypothetical protein
MLCVDIMLVVVEKSSYVKMVGKNGRWKGK